MEQHHSPPDGPIGALQPPTVLGGTLHVYVAFDWGEEVKLDRAQQLVPATVGSLPRRRRTPPSIGYRPPPLRFLLESQTLELPELGPFAVRPEATVFDFAGVSVALRTSFRTEAACLTRLAGWLADPAPFVHVARIALAPLHQQLSAAIQNPLWRDDLSEEYVVFQLTPDELPAPARLLEGHADWLAGLLRLDAGPLSKQEIADALRLSLSYRPTDLFVPDWAAAVLLDRDCEETLQMLEFANLQLLELRHLDAHLDGSLGTAYSLIHKLTLSRLPILGGHGRRLRALGELKVVATEMFERTGNVLKLVGDQYLARAYARMAERFHLSEWEQSIRRKLDVIESVYQVLSDQSATYRAEVLEIIVVVLIVLEIALAFLRP
jgi:hypothetical protein